MIRHMTYEDIPEVIDMIAEMKAESPSYADYIEDEGYLHRNLESFIDNPNVILQVAESVGLAGMMLGAVSPSWYSPTIEAAEMVLFVRVEHRGSSLAVRLIRNFEHQAKELGAAVMFAGVSTGADEAKVIRMYEKLGFTKTATGVMKRL